VCLKERDFVWGVFRFVFRGLDRVYVICQELSLGSNSKSDIIWAFSWGLLWVLSRVCLKLPGVLFGVPQRECLCLGCFQGCS